MSAVCDHLSRNATVKNLGEYGIRIEDDALVVDEGDDFIGFQKMSLGIYQNQFSINLFEIMY